MSPPGSGRCWSASRRTASIWDRTQNDVVVVASMEVCEWLELLAAYGKAHHLTDTDWLRSKAAQTHDAIETRAYDPQAGYYYLLCRRGGAEMVSQRMRHQRGQPRAGRHAVLRGLCGG